MAIYDGIILGAGHNSLVLQCYLGQAGLKTICIERSLTAGGGLATVEDLRHPGFMHNTHSFFHRGVTSMPWYSELGLSSYDVRYLQPELNVAMLLKDGRSLEWWTDTDRTVDSVSEFSSHDAKAVRNWAECFETIVTDILEREAQRPPVEAKKRASFLSNSPEGRLLLKTSELSPLEFVMREFTDPVVRAGMLFFNGLREVDLRAKGYGHHIPSLLASHSKAQMCVGGSASLARGLVAASHANGGEVRLGVEPREILVDGGRVTGIVTMEDEVIQSRTFVASGLNPYQTFVELLDPRTLSAAWLERARNFKFNVIAPLFGINLNLSAPPHYSAADRKPHLDSSLMTILGLEHVDQYEEIVRCHEAGVIPPPVLWGSTPTRFDSSQAPSGMHTSFMWEKAPYRLGGDPRNWDDAGEAHGEELFRKWSEYAPNLSDITLDRIVRTPLDVERSFPNMRFGDLLVGSFMHGQVGFNRPFEGAGSYRGGLRGLYLCGSSSHPGGNITGLPGRNCAQVLLSDLGIPQSWMPKADVREAAT